MTREQKKQNVIDNLTRHHQAIGSRVSKQWLEEQAEELLELFEPEQKEIV